MGLRKTPASPYCLKHLLIAGNPVMVSFGGNCQCQSGRPADGEGKKKEDGTIEVGQLVTVIKT
jgi:hypothetical protein